MRSVPYYNKYPILKLSLWSVLIILLTGFFFEGVNARTNHDIVTAIVLRDSPPLQFYNEESGQANGFAVDNMNNIAERAGLNVSYIYADTWYEMIQKVSNGEADIIPSLAISEERQKELIYTEVLHSSPISVFVRSQDDKVKGLSKGLNVATTKGSIVYEYIRKNPGLNITLYGTFSEGLFALLAGEINAFVAADWIVLKLARNAGIDNRIKIVGKPVMDIKRAMAMRKDNIVLRDKLNNVIKGYVGSPAYKNIYVKWYGKPASFWTVRNIIYFMSAIILATVIAMAVWRYRTVTELNRELKARILEQKAAEEAYKESSKRYRLLSDVAFDGIALTEKGVILEANEEFAKIFGFSQSEMSGMHVSNLIAPDYVDYVMDKITLGYDHPYEAVSVRKDGARFFVEVYGKNFSYNDRTLRISALRDISERKQAEYALLEEKKFTETAIDSQIDTFFLFEPDTGKAVRWNKQFRNISGYSDEEISAMKVPDAYYSQEDLEKAKDAINDVMSQGLGQAEISLICKDGRRIPFEYIVSVIRDNDGNIKYFVSIGRDITDRKKAEEEQKRLNAELMVKNKELEQVLYVTSHDLRSPLVNIQGYSRELVYSLKEMMSSIEHMNDLSHIKEKITPIVKNDIAESLHYIETSVLKMNTLLKGILSLSRLGNAELQTAEIDMNKMMTEIVDTHRFKLNELHIKTEVSTLPSCTGDSAQINQVFSNLVDNAIKYSYSEASSVIQISGFKDKGRSVYCVVDTGIGISPEHKDKIFEIFHQLEPNRVKGEGMGLTIAHRIIEKHNGKIWVESEVGKGSKFFVSLPS